ncbi:MAG: hypothetical protein WCT46_04950 [Candidatus Gracilibacteria bacterium]|jgi:hypothetical protein
MKAFYITGSIIMTVIILILAFENIQSSCDGLLIMFYSLPTSTPTGTIFFEAILGIITGVFYTQLFRSIVEKSDEDDDDGSY